MKLKLHSFVEFEIYDHVDVEIYYLFEPGPKIRDPGEIELDLHDLEEIDENMNPAEFDHI